MIVEIEKDSDGELILPLGEDLMDQMGWKVGDTIQWIDNGDESIEIDLINLGLTELPDLPQSLQKLQTRGKNFSLVFFFEG